VTIIPQPPRHGKPLPPGAGGPPAAADRRRDHPAGGRPDREL